MARMTNKQIDYACDRLESITMQLLRRVEEPEEPEKRDFDEIVKAWAKGELGAPSHLELVEVAKKSYEHSSWNVGSRFGREMVNFYYDIERQMHQKDYDKQKALFRAHVKHVRTEAQHVKDQIMLGDVEEALNLLKKFADFS